jgi:hypothetical protein
VYKAGGEKVDKKTKICEHWEQRFVWLKLQKWTI